MQGDMGKRRREGPSIFRIALLTAVLFVPTVWSCSTCPSSCLLRTTCDKYAQFPVKLRWLRSAQFAGYYAAKAFGFWEDECLAVSLRPNSYDYDPPEIWNLDADTRAVIPWYK